MCDYHTVFSCVEACACDLRFLITKNCLAFKINNIDGKKVISDVLVKSLTLKNFYLFTLTGKMQVSQKGSHLQNLMDVSVPPPPLNGENPLS